MTMNDYEIQKQIEEAKRRRLKNRNGGGATPASQQTATQQVETSVTETPPQTSTDNSRSNGVNNQMGDDVSTETNHTQSTETDSVGKSVKKKKNKQTGSGYIPTENIDYIKMEKENGRGFGIDGIGRMVTLLKTKDEDGKPYYHYVLRKETSTSKSDRLLSTDENATVDVLKRIKVSALKPLFDIALESTIKRLNLQNERHSISNTSYLTFLLFTQLNDDFAKSLLRELMAEKNYGFAVLVDAYEREEREGNLHTPPVMGDLEILIKEMYEQVNGNTRAVEALKRDNKKLREDVVFTKATAQSLQRVQAFELLDKFGLISTTLPKNAEQAIGYLNKDETLKMTNELLEIGNQESKRMETYRVTNLRNNK